MIAIIDYGMGNLGSICNMLRRIGTPFILASDRGMIQGADKLILPGVGAFDRGVENLKRLEFDRVLNEMVLERRVPILGICLGMQLFSKCSEEGDLDGLGWINAKTVRFKFESEPEALRIPHMGWNTIEVVRPSPIFEGLEVDARFYFVHSYHVRCENEEQVLASSIYGIKFTAAVIKANILGTQFHPEKSHKYGLSVLHKFASM